MQLIDSQLTDSERTFLIAALREGAASDDVDAAVAAEARRLRIVAERNLAAEAERPTTPQAP